MTAPAPAAPVVSLWVMMRDLLGTRPLVEVTGRCWCCGATGQGHKPAGLPAAWRCTACQVEWLDDP